MPEVSRFYGIVIRFYFREHPPTHFHAFYGEFEALIDIETGAIHEGYIPKTAYGLVKHMADDSSGGASGRLETGAATAASFAHPSPRLILNPNFAGGLAKGFQAT